MKKVLIGLGIAALIALTVGGGVFAWLRRVRPTPPVNNSALAQGYRKAGDLLKTGGDNPDKAIESLKKLAEQDAGNALNAYYLAAAYANRGDWTDAARELKAGNDAPYCVAYQREGTVLDIAPNLAALRGLTRACATAPSTSGGERNEALLLDARKMGTRIAQADPKMVINVLVGVAIHAVADRNLAQIYTTQGKTKDAETAQQRIDAETTWARSAEFKQDAGMIQNKSEDDALLAKYHVTSEQFTAAMLEKPQSAEIKKKMQALNVELLAREKTRTEKLLKAMPE